MTSRVELSRQDARDILENGVSRLSSLKASTLVVTGGAGFLGSWIAELIACLNDDYAFGTKLVLVDRDFSEFNQSRKHLASRKDFVLINENIRNFNGLPRETSWIVHAAATPDSRFHASNPMDTMLSIGEGTSNILQQASRCSELKMLLNISSALVSGSQPVDLEYLTESWCGSVQPIAPTNAYSESKRYAEMLCAVSRSQSHLPVLCARPFAFMGPYQSLEAPWAINNFLQDALNGQAIRVLGNGETVRSYLYGAEFALWALIMLVQGKTGQTYNIGSSETISLRDAAALVASCFQANLEIKIGGSMHNTHKVSRLVPNVELVGQQLGLEMKIKLKSALERTIAWHRAG